MPLESVQLSDDMSKALTRLDASCRCGKSSMMLDARQECIGREAWVLADLRTAVAEADMQLFATADEIYGVLKKWGIEKR
jgi:predicted transcriptional regulator